MTQEQANPSFLQNEANKVIDAGRSIIMEACENATIGSPALIALFDTTHMFLAKWNLDVAEENLARSQGFDKKVVSDHAAAQGNFDTLVREIQRNGYAIPGYFESHQRINQGAIAISAGFRYIDATTVEQKTYEELGTILSSFHPLFGKKK